MDFNGFRLILMDFDFFGACRSPKELVERPKELVERLKCTKESPRKGGGLRSAPPRGTGAFGARPPLWIPLWVLVFVYFGLLGYISVLLEHFLTLLPYKLSRAEPSRRLFTWTRFRRESWQIKPRPNEK